MAFEKEEWIIADQLNGYPVTKISNTSWSDGDSGSTGTTTKRIVLPMSVQVVDPYAFCQMINVEEVTIPNPETVVSAYAFRSYSYDDTIVPSIDNKHATSHDNMVIMVEFGDRVFANVDPHIGPEDITIPATYHGKNVTGVTVPMFAPNRY